MIRVSCFVKNIKAVIRVSCFVIRENRWSRLVVALPANAGGLVNLAFIAFVCATELGITRPEKRLFSPDAMQAGAEKKD